MPRGVYERRNKRQILVGQLRNLADEIEAELTKAEELRSLIAQITGPTKTK